MEQTTAMDVTEFQHVGRNTAMALESPGLDASNKDHIGHGPGLCVGDDCRSFGANSVVEGVGGDVDGAVSAMI